MASRLTHLGRRVFSPFAVAVLILGFAASAANASFFNLIRSQLVRADLRMASFALDKSAASTGETVTATVNISNEGTLNATSTQLTLWAANGTTPSRIATLPLGTLSPQARLTHVSTFTVPTSIPAGTHQIHAGVETSAYEWNRDNNTGATTLTVLAQVPPTPPPPAPPAPPAPPTPPAPPAPPAPPTPPAPPAPPTPPVPPTPPLPPAPPRGEEPACDYFASPNGTGDGLRSASPFKIQNFWTVAAPGKTLCLLDGTYQSADDMIAPPSGLSGTAGNPITIRCLNEGQCLIDGQFARSPVSLGGNDWLVLEGFNAKNSSGSVVFLSGSHNNIVRRVIAWDASICRNSHVWQIASSSNNLFEDIAGFGTARKIFEPVSNSNNNTVRRAWFRWEGHIREGNKIGGTVIYNSSGTVFENVLSTWSGESMPEEYDLHEGNCVAKNPVRRLTNFHVQQAKGLFSVDRHDTNKCVNARVLGSLAYVNAGDRLPAGPPLPIVYIHGLSCFHIRHSMVFISPGNPRFNNHVGFQLQRDPRSGGVPMTDISAHNITSVRGLDGDVFHADWEIQNISAGTSLSAVADPWMTTTTRANFCKRWVNGVVTNDPLWPWPMNGRIKAATASAGAYAGPCPTCLGGRATRTATDVTAQVETLLGTIPAACRN